MEEWKVKDKRTNNINKKEPLPIYVSKSKMLADSQSTSHLITLADASASFCFDVSFWLFLARGGIGNYNLKAFWKKTKCDV